MKKLQSLGFTLVELLIVMGVLAVLVVTILVSLNPSEAQKKSRDIKRMKDMSTLEAIMLQFINDGNAPVCPSACTSTSGVQTPSASWITGANLSNYTSSVPIDPSNGSARTCVGADTTVTTASPAMGACTPVYKLIMSGSDYEINVRQESKSNVNNTYNDGGGDRAWAESGSSLTLLDNESGY